MEKKGTVKTMNNLPIPLPKQQSPFVKNVNLNSKGIKRRRSESSNIKNEGNNGSSNINNNSNSKGDMKKIKKEIKKEDPLIGNNEEDDKYLMQKFIEDYNNIMGKTKESLSNDNLEILEKLKKDLFNIFEMLEEMEKQSLCVAKFIDYCIQFKLDAEKLFKITNIERENMKSFVSNSIRYWSSFESDSKKRRKHIKNSSNQNNSSSSSTSTQAVKDETNPRSQQLPIFNDIKTNITHIDIPNINESITTKTTNIYLSTIY
jgi:hypothetical protein